MESLRDKCQCLPSLPNVPDTKGLFHIPQFQVSAQNTAQACPGPGGDSQGRQL